MQQTRRMNKNKPSQDKEAQRKSIIITAILSSLILLLILNYKWTIKKADPKIEIAVLFDDAELPKPPEEPIVPKPVKITPENSAPSKQASSSNKNTSATGKVSSSKYKHNPKVISEVQKEKSPVDAAPNTSNQDLGKEEQKSDNRQENSALNNLLKNRNQGGGSNGEGNDGRIRGSRNQGSGQGEGNGEGLIGQGGRKLVSKIPGTMGDSRPSLENTCQKGGLVTFKYTVSKGGSILTVQRSGGVSNTCLTDLGVSWIKKYVKANPGNSTARGEYKINFK